MTQYLEDHIPVVKYEGVNTTKDVAISGATTLSGTNTLSGATTISGALTLSSTVAGVRRAVVSGTDATYALTAAQSGTVFFATKTSATQTYTLPSAATAGLEYTFICGHADGEILINPTSSDDITITTFGAVGADADTGIVTTTGATGIKNTAATNAVGDSVTLVSDGTKWFGIGITSGIWAAQ